MDRRGLPALSKLEMTPGQLEQMRSHVQSCLPHEGCGLLVGKAGIVHEVIPITNAAHSPVRFRMDPAEQLAAFDRMDAEGLELLGIFHSHPSGPSGPSATDVAEAAYPVVYVIWSLMQDRWQAGGFSIQQSRVSEVKLYAADGKQSI